MNEEQQVKKTDKRPNVSAWFNRGWEIFTSDLANFIVIGLIYLVVIVITSGSIVGEFLFIGPLCVSFFYIIFNKMRGQSVNIGDMGKGFNFFVAAVLSNILITVFSVIGYALCIIPGIIVTAIYLLTPALIVEQNLDFWAAMEKSRKITSAHLVEFFLLALILIVLNFVGALVLIVGLLFTIPLSFAIVAAAYEDIVGLEGQVQQEK